MTETLHETPGPPAAPTEELSPASPVPASSEVSLNPDQDTFLQLQVDAIERGRPDMVGLEWQEGNLRYRVSNYEQLTRTRHEPTKTGLPRFVMRGQIEGGPAIERKDSYVSENEVVERRTIDVFNADGDLVDILSFAGRERRPIVRQYKFEGKIQKKIEKLRRVEKYTEVDRFADFFMVNSRANPNAEGATTHKKPRQITNVHWVEGGELSESNSPEGPTNPAGYNSVPVPLVDSKVSFYAIADQQASLGLENWRGLAWTDHQNNKKRVTRDVVIIKKNSHSGVDYPVRVFEVKTYGRDGIPIHSHMYTLAELQDHFGDRDKLYKDTAPEHKLHWEIPAPISQEQALGEETPPTDPLARWYWNEERAWTNWAPPNRTRTEQKPDSEQLPLFDADGNPTQADDYKVLSREQADNFRAQYIEDGRVLLSTEGGVELRPKEEAELRRGADNLVKAFNDYLAEHQTPKTDISLDEAFGLLSSPELHSDNETLRDSINRLKAKPEMYGHAVALKATLAELDINRLHEMVAELHDSYNTDLRRLGIEVPRREKHSFSWIIDGLLSQRLKGGGNPFEDSATGHELRKGFITTRLGEKFLGVAVDDVKKVISDWDKDEPEKPVDETVHLYTENFAVIRKLRDLLYKKQLEAMVKKRRTSRDADYTDADFMDTGLMIRRSFGRN